MKYLKDIPKSLLLIFIALNIGIIVFLSITKQIFKPLEFSAKKIILSKRQFNKKIKSNIELKIKAENEIKSYIIKIDSINMAIDSINRRELSNIKELQRFYNNY